MNVFFSGEAFFIPTLQYMEHSMIQTVKTAGFTACEVLARKAFFKQLTGAAVFTAWNVTDGMREQRPPRTENVLVILNLQQPLALAGEQLCVLRKTQMYVLLYAERAENPYLIRCIQDDPRLCAAVCLCDYEVEPCRTALMGGTQFISAAAAKLLRRPPTSVEKGLAALTDMQREVMFLLMRGKTYEQIADDFHTTTGSIRHIRSCIYKCLQHEYIDGRIPLDVLSWLGS